MTRRITLVSALLVSIGLAAIVYQTLPEPVPEPTIELTAPADQGPPPKLEVVGPSSHEFGSMIVGSKGSHAWVFKNTGAGPLEVWLEETTCSCTVATLKSAAGEKSKRIKIEPGKSSPIEVGWETRKPGKFGQAATIGTNDPNERSVVLSILGTVFMPVEVQPSELITFPDAGPEESRRTTVAVVSHDRPGLKLTKIVTTRPDLLVAEARPMPAAELDRLNAKSGYNLIVEVKPGSPTGRFSEEILIETNHPDRTSLKVGVAGNTVGPITVVPARIRMPNVASRAGASQDLSLIVRGDGVTNFQVASKSAKLQVAISREEKPDSKGRYRLTVTIPPGTAPGLVDDPIVLKTDHPKAKEVRIPVAIYVSSRSDAG